MMAYGPRLVRASSQRKLDALLAKAAVLIAKQGFEATSMRDLSAAMNGSLAGLYHYFTSKEDLLFQLQHRTFSGLLAAQQEVAAHASKKQQGSSGRYNRPIATGIVPASPFYRAEEYHQQYLEKRGQIHCHIK